MNTSDQTKIQTFDNYVMKDAVEKEVRYPMEFDS